MAGIETVAVIGAGVTGAGIAAPVANAGVPVVLLDIVPPGASDRNVVADAAHAILMRPARECTGNFFIDEEVLRQEGVADLDP